MFKAHKSGTMPTFLLSLSQLSQTCNVFLKTIVRIQVFLHELRAIYSFKHVNMILNIKGKKTIIWISLIIFLILRYSVSLNLYQLCSQFIIHLSIYPLTIVNTQKDRVFKMHSFTKLKVKNHYFLHFFL